MIQLINLGVLRLLTLRYREIIIHWMVKFPFSSKSEINIEFTVGRFYID